MHRSRPFHKDVKTGSPQGLAACARRTGHDVLSLGHSVTGPKGLVGEGDQKLGLGLLWLQSDVPGHLRILLAIIP